MDDRSADRPVDGLTLSSAAGRWVVLATVLGSAVAGFTGTVVNVALPAVADDLGAGTAGVQWIATGYLLSLASLILAGGGLGDRVGRRRVYVVGIAVFALASVAAALAPTLSLLVAARVAQGVGAALFTPASLAILEATFRREDRAAAIGAWSGLSGVASAAGPLLGGWLLDVASWRWLFVLNLPLCLVAVVVALTHVPETRDESASGSLDLAGVVAGAVALAATTWALIDLADGPVARWAPALAIGVLAATAFVAVERTVDAPLVPPDLFADRVFAVANLLTFVVYAALSGVFFLLVVVLQVVMDLSPLAAGSSLVPITVLMLLFSARAGRWSALVGPRLPLTIGPLVLAGAMLLLTRIDTDARFVPDVLPAVVLFGIGLVALVAPVTATVLGAADERHAGAASGVNNAVARAAGLLAIAVLPAAAGLGGEAFSDPVALADGFGRAMVITAGLAVAGAAVAAVGLRGGSVDVSAEVHDGCPVNAPPTARAPSRA